MAIYNITSQQLKGTGILNSFEMSGVGSFSNVYSLNFDGNDDFVDLGNIKPTGAMTISYWFKGKSTTGNVTTLGTMGSSGQRGYTLSVNNNNNWFFAIPITSTSTKNLSHALTIDDTKWYHFAGVYNPSTYMRLFIDGSQVAEVTSGVPSSQYVGNSNSTKIGNRGDGGTFGRFIGNMDEVAFFDSALTNDNISTIYTGGPNDISDLSPLSWYRMGDGDTFPTLTDNGSGGNNGTMTNMVSADIEEDVPS